MGELTDCLVLQLEDWQQMQRHVAASLPNEACGLVAGLGNQSKRIFEVENSSHSATSFRMDANGQVGAFMQMEELGLDLLAIYHSHPQGPGEPSHTDLEEFAYPGVLYLIWSPDEGKWRCRAFELENASCREVPWCFFSNLEQRSAKTRVT